MAFSYDNTNETEQNNTPENTPLTPEENTAPDSVVSEESAKRHSLPRRILDRLLYFLGGYVPKRGDPPLEVARKIVFVVALIVFVASVSYLANDMVISPAITKSEYDTIASKVDPSSPAEPPADFTDYPTGILPQYKAAYAQNQDMRGWITYADDNTDSSKNWLSINYPVVYSGDNDYYLHHDFLKQNNSNGAPFLDYRTKVDSADSKNKATVIYGHDMRSMQMFAKLNWLLKSVDYARSAPVVNFNTIYSNGNQYKVFAVMLLNENEKDGPTFDYLRTDFSGSKDFMDYVANCRARSYYDYNDVDVKPDDELLVLSTCSETSYAKFEDSRCAVVARKVRSGESTDINSSSIQPNEDVIKPLAWYKNQNKTPHPFYTDSNYVIPGT